MLSCISDKAILSNSRAVLKENMAIAMSLFEAHLPSTELDIKAHDIIHLVDRLFDLGPEYTTAMWGYEDLLGRLVDMMTNVSGSCAGTPARNSLITRSPIARHVHRPPVQRSTS
jgi:hypothetical protein